MTTNYTPPEYGIILITLFDLITAENDILVREELEDLTKQFPDRFHLHFTLDRAPASGWKYSEGFVTKEMIEKHGLFDKSPAGTQVFMCGPPPMIKFACQPNLEQLGFGESQMVVF